jgi:hypothetical protein
MKVEIKKEFSKTVKCEMFRVYVNDQPISTFETHKEAIAAKTAILDFIAYQKEKELNP